jgi:CRP-like cAMP-binding protein
VLAALTDLRGSNPSLRRVGASWFVTNFAEWAYVTALAIYGYRTHGALAIGLIGARFVPGALLGALLVGAVAHYRPTLVLRIVSLSRCVVVAGAAAAVATHAPLAVLVATIWVDAVIAAPYRPVQSAILPALSGTPRELSAVAGSVPSSKALAQAAGALAGSAALALVSPQTIVFAAAAALLCAAALVAPVRPESPLPALQPAMSATISRRRRYLSVRAGFEMIARRARPLLLLGGTRALTRGVWTSLAVVASIRLLHLGSTGVGILMAAAGVGAAAAVPLSLRFAGRRGLARPAALMFALAGIPISLVGLIGRPAPAVAIVVVWGAAFALADSISNSLIHRVVEYRLLAPSVAAIESSKLLLEGLGALAAPGLLAILGIRDALIVAGAPLPLLVAVSRGGLLAVDAHAATRGRPMAALRRAPSFRGLTMLSLENITARLQQKTVAADSQIIHQGDVGDRFYLIETGRVAVTVDGFRVAILGPGGSFGEKALLRGAQRSATVTSLEPTGLWYLDGPDFVAAATGIEGPVARRVQRSTGRSLEEVLAAVPLFAAIEPRGLASRGQLSSAPAGEEIVRQGESGDRFHVLLEGEAEVAINGQRIRDLTAGDSFGEIALLHSVPRTATVTTMVESRLWSLDRDTFLSTLGQAALLDGAAPDGAVAGAGLLV